MSFECEEPPLEHVLGCVAALSGPLQEAFLEAGLTG